MASNEESYASRSWSLLTRDEGWIKPVLVLAAARLIPIVGGMGANGYALEWARLTSWGVDSAPKQKNVDVGACLKSGARAFVVALGYGAVFGLIQAVFGIFTGPLGFLTTLIISAAAMAIGNVAKLRATIYQRIGAGYQVDRIIDMVKRDYKGLARVAGFGILLMAGVGVVASATVGMVVLFRLGSILPTLMDISEYGYVDDMTVAFTVLGAIASMMPLMFVMSYFVHIASSIVDLLLCTAVGLWMRQFDVRNWGESSDPLPGDPAAHAPRPQSDSQAWGAGPVPTRDENVAPASTTPVQPSADEQKDIEAQIAALSKEKAGEQQPATPSAPSDDGAAQDEAASSEAKTGEKSTAFSLNDSPVKSAANEAAEFYEAEGRFTLDDPEPATDEAQDVVVETFSLDDQDAQAPQDAKDEVKTFTLDDPKPAEEPEAPVEGTAFTLNDAQPADKEDAKDSPDEVLDEIKEAIAQADLEWPEIPAERAYHEGNEDTQEKPAQDEQPKLEVETFDLDDVAKEGKPVPPADSEDNVAE